MTRSASRRSSAVQAEKTHPPLTQPTETRADSSPSVPPSASAIPWYWRIALFVWLTSFVCLLLYEWLAGLVKALSKAW